VLELDFSADIFSLNGNRTFDTQQHVKLPRPHMPCLSNLINHCENKVIEKYVNTKRGNEAEE
jgi:hypothetical protein